MPQHANVPFELKAVDENIADGWGRFDGYASVYGALDLVGDIVEKGAFTKTIKDRGGEVPMLWQHSWSDPIGVLELEDSDRGLKVKGRIDLDIPQGQRAFSGVKKRYCKGLSIGYDTIKATPGSGTKPRRLHELKLWEVSVVTFPALPIAEARNAKNMTVDWEDAERLFVESLRRMTAETKLATIRARIRSLEHVTQSRRRDDILTERFEKVRRDAIEAKERDKRKQAEGMGSW